jgi:hypothetical protein
MLYGRGTELADAEQVSSSVTVREDAGTRVVLMFSCFLQSLLSNGQILS